LILLSHPTGNTFVRALLKGLQGRGLLGLFATTIAVHGDEAWLKALPEKTRAEVLRRRYDLPAEKLFARPWLEIARLAGAKLELPVTSVDAVYMNHDANVAELIDRRRDCTGVYAYEDGAMATFASAQRFGMGCFYELPIAYWQTSQRLLNEEAERWPRWKQTLPGASEPKFKLDRKTAEIEMADVVICPSEFVRLSAPAKERKKCVVAEFGSPAREKPPVFRAPDKKPRILFAGSMTQRKGLADLFAAMKLVKSKEIELVVMGSPLAAMEFYRSEFADFIYEAPRPHAKVLELMESCDVLALPSIVEGRALVQQEAMSCGLPLIVTKNAGGEDLIEEGRTGFLVPIRAPEAMAEKLDWFVANRDKIPEMKRAAFEKAATLTWERYVNLILKAIGHG
jgi:glycosyltransferase involved in cell wall biosynthesis